MLRRSSHDKSGAAEASRASDEEAAVTEASASPDVFRCYRTMFLDALERGGARPRGRGAYTGDDAAAARDLGAWQGVSMSAAAEQSVLRTHSQGGPALPNSAPRTSRQRRCCLTRGHTARRRPSSKTPRSSVGRCSYTLRRASPRARTSILPTAPSRSARGTRFGGICRRRLRRHPRVARRGGGRHRLGRAAVTRACAGPRP